MTEIAFSSSFKRAFKRRVAGNANVETRFWERLEAFKEDPFDPKLRTHKLSGALNPSERFSSQCPAFQDLLAQGFRRSH